MTDILQYELILQNHLIIMKALRRSVQAMEKYYSQLDPEINRGLNQQILRTSEELYKAKS